LKQNPRTPDQFRSTKEQGRITLVKSVQSAVWILGLLVSGRRTVFRKKSFISDDKCYDILIAGNENVAKRIMTNLNSAIAFRRAWRFFPPHCVPPAWTGADLA
jgi:hypothetical protein